MRGEEQAAIEHRIMTGTRYRGIPTQKNPMDAWVYHEIIVEQTPEVIVEVGNHEGGSLLYLADAWPGTADVVGVDLDHSRARDVKKHSGRIRLVTGDALDVFSKVQQIVAGRTCLVIEDSAHTYDHTLAVLRTYSALVHVGGYMVCEDGVMEPVAQSLEQFTGEQESFVADRVREWPFTWNPGGYLRRVA